MKRYLFIFFSVLIVAGSPQNAVAQDAVWIQVEAQPSLAEARERARDYSSALSNVSGFRVGPRWYAIALGPFSPGDAEQVMLELKGIRAIPQDSFIAFPANFGAQYWPIGANSANAQNVSPDAVAPVTAAPEELPELKPSDESKSEAIASERLLNRDEKRLLQTAMKWAGVYPSVVDGLFGAGTRRAMSQWQVENGYESTGILTTGQRAELLRDYNSVLDGMGIFEVSNPQAGIAMKLPTGVVSFDRFDPPFVRYESSGDIKASVLMISQPGDQDALTGLYNMMETLKIVPREGPRELGNSSFVLEGIGKRYVSYTQAALRDGYIKGFTLVWPAGDEDRRTRILDEMKASFTVIDGVLNPSLNPPGADQAPNLVAGLEIRRPKLSRTGLFLNETGQVLTTIDVLQSCTRITLNEEVDAQPIAQDPALGLAVLNPLSEIAPTGIGAFQTSFARLGSEFAVSGYSYEGALGGPTLTFGTLVDLKGLRGETHLDRFDMATLPGDAGGPMLDAAGHVTGILLPNSGADGTRLPDGVSFAADAQAITGFLDRSDIAYSLAEGAQALRPEDIAIQGEMIAVLVGCWDQ